MFARRGDGGADMVRPRAIERQGVTLEAQAQVPPAVLFGNTEIDLWPYRPRTMALLRRYARASVEIGRLPSLLGREFFRSRVTSYSMRTFEDTMVFVTDMEHTLEGLHDLDKKLIAMSALEEYTISEISRALGCSEKTIGRLLHDAIDQLSRCLIIRGLLERLPETPREGGVTTRLQTH
jgi:RNA polymerase sigma factor (sigma-70 family)